MENLFTNKIKMEIIFKVNSKYRIYKIMGQEIFHKED